MRNSIKLLLATTLLAVSLTGIVTSAHAKQDKDRKAYFLLGDARPGSKFKQKLFRSDVPFDKTYSELSPTLKERVKTPYGGLKASEHPPFPQEGTEAIYRPLYKANLKLEKEGDVLAIAMISETGKVENVTVYKAPTPNIATMLSYIITNTKFDPATCDGKPCKMEYLFENKIESKPNWAR